MDELDDRCVIGGLPQLELVILFLLLDGLADGVGQVALAAGHEEDVLDRRHGPAQVQAGAHLEVVHREDVRGIGHRHEQGALVEEGDGQRVVAPNHVGQHHADRPHVDGEGVQVHVVEAEPLGERVGELVGRDAAALHQHASDGLADLAALLNGRFDGLAGRVAEVSTTMSPMRRSDLRRCVGGVSPGVVFCSSAVEGGFTASSLSAGWMVP